MGDLEVKEIRGGTAYLGGWTRRLVTRGQLTAPKRGRENELHKKGMRVTLKNEVQAEDTRGNMKKNAQQTGRG